MFRDQRDHRQTQIVQAIVNGRDGPALLIRKCPLDATATWIDIRVLDAEASIVDQLEDPGSAGLNIIRIARKILPGYFEKFSRHDFTLTAHLQGDFFAVLKPSAHQ